MVEPINMETLRIFYDIRKGFLKCQKVKSLLCMAGCALVVAEHEVSHCTSLREKGSVQQRIGFARLFFPVWALK
jgi:hypothetical protein